MGTEAPLDLLLPSLLSGHLQPFTSSMSWVVFGQLSPFHGLWCCPSHAHSEVSVHCGDQAGHWWHWQHLGVTQDRLDPQIPVSWAREPNTNSRSCYSGGGRVPGWGDNRKGGCWPSVAWELFPGS